VFDIGFSELLLIAVVALVVLGPERLPKAARFAGLWVRRARNQWDSVKQELERELHAEELKRNLQAVRHSMQQTEAGLRDQAGQVRGEVDGFRQEVEQPAPATEPVIEPRPITADRVAGVPAPAGTGSAAGDHAIPSDSPQAPADAAEPKP
jgi:sec-independent protein translocase protein TatB